MEMLNGTARILRNRHRYKGFIHLKIIPGASDAAVEEAVSLASAVSLNIETTGAKRMRKLSSRKDYIRDIIEPIKLISRLTGKGTRYSRVKQTTQFIVGAADESDTEIVKYMSGLYDRLNMHRVYFSAYQNGLGDKELEAAGPGAEKAADTFMREHRLYQVDFLLRRYGFKEKDILFGEDGKLSLETDPKEVWARNHPEFFPVNANYASKFDLLRVPGLGPITVGRILQQRRYAKLHRIEDVGKVGVLLKKAGGYIRF
jgi:predicted DNA-binding helix-hairpin-helix protein